jgi:RNA-binding protein
MKFANTISVRVFIHDKDNEPEVKKGLLNLFPFDLEKERINLEESLADFEEDKIKICRVMLVKEKHTNAFIKNLLSKLSKEQKETLTKQKESRLDDELNFFIRLDKDKIMNEQKYELTETGRCYHIKINIASFPHKKDSALKVITEIFK